MKKSYPRWLVPRLSDAVQDVVTARARLGGQVRASQMTDEERSEAGRHANRARNRNLTPEQRSELAGIAGRQRWKGHIPGPKKRPPRLDPEETIARKRAGGIKGQAIRMQTSTPKQRSEWSRASGIASAAKRWAGHVRKWPKQKPKRRGYALHPGKAARWHHGDRLHPREKAEKVRMRPLRLTALRLEDRWRENVRRADLRDMRAPGRKGQAPMPGAPETVQRMEGKASMAEHIELTWPDGDGNPMRIIDSNPVSYEREETIVENGKKVIKTTKVEFTACSARPATEAELRQWRDQ